MYNFENYRLLLSSCLVYSCLVDMCHSLLSNNSTPSTRLIGKNFSSVTTKKVVINPKLTIKSGDSFSVRKNASTSTVNTLLPIRPNATKISPTPKARHRDSPKTVFNVAVMLPFYGELPITLEKAYASLIVALRMGNEILKPLSVSLGWVMLDTGSDDRGNSDYQQCVERFTSYRATQVYYRFNISLFLGPVCHNSFHALAFLASRWNVPLITPLGPNQNNPQLWPTVVRSGYSVYHVVEVFMEILEFYNWTTYYLVQDTNSMPMMMNFGEYMITYAPIRPTAYMAFNSLNINENFLFHILTGSMLARVFFIDAHDIYKREILLNAYDLGLFQKGEYVFVMIELWKASQGSFFDLEKDLRIEDLKRAYESVLLITLKKYDDVSSATFIKKLKKMTAKMLTYNYQYEDEEISPYVLGYQTGILMFATALRMKLMKKEDPYDGISMANQMMLNRISGPMGNIMFTTSGDQILDYVVWSFDPKSQNWKTLFTYNILDRIKLREPKVWAYGTPSNIPECGYKGDAPHCIPHEPLSVLGIVAIILSCIILIALVLAVIFFRRVRYESELADRWWEAKMGDIVVINEKKKPKSYYASLPNTNAIVKFFPPTPTTQQPEPGLSKNNEEIEPLLKRDTTATTTMEEREELGDIDGEFRGIQVTVHRMYIDTKFHISRQMLVELQLLRDIQHTNVSRFLGLGYEEDIIYVVDEYCAKGTLEDMLQNKSITLDIIMRESLIRDIAAGMSYLHSTPIKFHGNLMSSICYIDSRFSVKLSGYGLSYVRNRTIETYTDENVYYKKKLYKAPEILKNNVVPASGTPKGDVYSFGILAHEVIYRTTPFNVSGTEDESYDSLLTPKQAYDEVIKAYNPISMVPFFRPKLPEDTDTRAQVPVEMIQLMQSCWSENPKDRPNFQQIRNALRRMNKGKEENVVDNLLHRMEMYTNNLESLVEERTSAYLEQKKKAENLLYAIMPKPVADKLKMGSPVEPVAYESVTLYFSDLLGFAALSSESTPFEIVNFLNDIYTCFDNIINYFDVYKVETIGDSYMVVSGAPVLNGNNHAREICRLSLALLQATADFRIRHRPPNEKVKLRIGIHSGPIAAGVVGLKSPRFCLFGDTVNTSSRMESNGEAFKIHVSPYTLAILQKFGSFVLECRGEIKMKGKGVMTTYWLLGEKDGDGRYIDYTLEYLEFMKNSVRKSRSNIVKSKESLFRNNNDTNQQQSPLLPYQEVQKSDTLKVPENKPGGPLHLSAAVEASRPNTPPNTNSPKKLSRDSITAARLRKNQQEKKQMIRDFIRNSIRISSK